MFNGNIKLSTGMILMVTLAVLAMMGLGGFAALELRHQHKVLMVKFEASEIDSTFRTQLRAWQNILVRGADMKEFRLNLADFNAVTSDVDNKLVALGTKAEELGIRRETDQGTESLAEHLQQMRDLHHEMVEKYLAVLKKYPDPSIPGWHRFLDWEVRGLETPFIKALNEEQAKLDEAIARNLARTQIELAITVFLFILAVVILNTLLIRRFTGPLKRLIDVARRMGEGDMTARLNMTANTEIGALAKVLDETAAGLSRLALKTQDMVDSLNTTSAEMTSSVTSQSTGASQQAAAVTEVTTTLEQIRENANITLDKALTLQKAAERVSVQGEHGARAVAQTSRAMADIQREMKSIAETILALSNQTQQIGDITMAVQNLSQQSKMLALNAAIEASKAGETGKGFAVVAAEMRQLAEQSEQATHQVAAILEQIRKATENAVMATEEGGRKVEEGNRMVEQAGTVVAELRGIINETAQVSGQITMAVNEEATGIQQASNAMGEISRVIRHFAATTQQNEAAAGEVGKLAQMIREGVSAYKVDLKAAE